MEYELYKGYVLGLHSPTRTGIYGTVPQIHQDTPVHVSGSSGEAMFWVDSEITMGGHGTVTQAVVDELNKRIAEKQNRVKEGILLLVVDRNGVQLYSTPLGSYNAWDYDSQRELGQRITEGLPDEAYEK